ncbi:MULTISPECIES: hypothetical protein [unclassified Acinetobacter]|uniref:hypothetical protein n=1 Tax=unclassified Acinetobacter TaxID=196816 RepID=UPI0004D712E6|nr:MULTISPECIES: hypothetical protein [unclassified Acinetobacter]KEC82658.1 hypothetical protein DT74_21535 [Acinetobacter sp. ETR1]WEE41539.1 hypothetical protein PYV58_10335 [Acinetobacter sp. TAC-1]
MKRKYWILLSPIILIACSQDWKADLGLGCHMNGKLCFEHFDYSNSSATNLILTSNNTDYQIEVKNFWANWLGCKSIDSVTTICSAQQLTIPLKDLNKQCEGKIDIVKYPKDKWILKYYIIEFKIQDTPPYILKEVDENKLSNLKFENWQRKQAIDYEQELLCGE